MGQKQAVSHLEKINLNGVIRMKELKTVGDLKRLLGDNDNGKDFNDADELAFVYVNGKKHINCRYEGFGYNVKRCGLTIFIERNDE